MIEDREIWACANRLLGQQGENACAVTARRADELLALGEIEGHRTFPHILDRIRVLEAKAPAEGLN